MLNGEKGERSEDTDVVGSMIDIVLGLLGSPPEEHPNGYPYVAGRTTVVACAKHFVGDGGTTREINENNTVASYDELYHIHMRPCFLRGWDNLEPVIVRVGRQRRKKPY